MNNSKQKTQKGFTLIELVIVLAIISIIATIAYPSYQDSIRKARRSTAQSILVETVNFLERRFTETNAFPVDNADLPFDQSPKTGDKFYDISFDSSGAIGFVLQAVPVSSSSQNLDSCGTLTISNIGVKGPASNCW